MSTRSIAFAVAGGWLALLGGYLAQNLLYPEQNQIPCLAFMAGPVGALVGFSIGKMTEKPKEGESTPKDSSPK